MQYDANRNSTIDVYRYDTGEKVRSLLNTRNFPELKSLFQYSFSPDESKLLLGTEYQPIYRRSVLAVYYVLDIATGELIQVDEDKIQEPSFSADGSRSEEHTSELQSRGHLVCRLLLEKKKISS